jgi:hypothetical protein
MRYGLLAIVCVACSRTTAPQTMTPQPPPPNSEEIASRLAADPAFVRAVADRISVRPVAPAAPLAALAPPVAPAGINDTITLAIARDGTMMLDGGPTSEASLRAELTRRLAADGGLRAVIAADTNTPYARVVHAMDILRSSGVTHIAVQATPLQGIHLE